MYRTFYLMNLPLASGMQASISSFGMSAHSKGYSDVIVALQLCNVSKVFRAML